MFKTPVYMMPGLAASPKIFDKISLPNNYEIHYLHWIIPSKNESLESYVKRLIKGQIKHKNPILLGVSFGGIIVQEMAKQIAVQKLVLISTVKTHKEFPPFFEKALHYRLYKLFPSKILQHVPLLQKIVPTKDFKQKMKLYKLFLTMDQPEYLNWAIKQVISWKQDALPENYIHIVGENDKVFQLKYIIEPRIVIPKGRHDMVIFKAKSINKVLNTEL